MKGRPKDPKRIRTRTGNRPKPDEARKLRSVAIDPTALVSTAPPVMPDAPEDLPEGARAIWDALAPEIEPTGLGAADLEMLRLLCLAAHRAREATALIERHGMIVQGARGPMINPAVRVEKDSTATYVRLAEQMGLTYAARLRLNLVRVVGGSLTLDLHRRLLED